MLVDIFYIAIAELITVLTLTAGVLFMIGYLILNSTSSVKSKGNATRIDTVVAGVGTQATRINGLSGNNTSNAGLPDGTIGGHTDTAGLANGTIGGQSGGQIGGASAHVHGPGSYSVNDGHHEHGANATDGTLAVNNGVHNHSLPSV